jgi:hypothetical protein
MIKTKQEEIAGRIKITQLPDPVKVKLAAINTKAKEGKLTLADINDKLDILLEEIKAKR